MIAAARRAALHEKEQLSLSLPMSEVEEESGLAWVERLEHEFSAMQEEQGRESFEELESSADTAMQLLLSELPDISECLMKGRIQKLDQNFDWKPFDIALSSEHVLFAKARTTFVFDSIPLCDIVHIECSLKEEEIPNFTDHQRANQQQTGEGEGMLQNTVAWRALKRQASQKCSTSSVPCFELRTCDGGYNSGRSYYLKPPNEDELASWTAAISKAVRASVARKAAERGRLRRCQAALQCLYRSGSFQALVALLITANFVVNIAQTELLPADGSPAQAQFATADTVFTGIRARSLLKHGNRRGGLRIAAP